MKPSGQQARKLVRLDDCTLNLQAGLRDHQPVVACALVFSQNVPDPAPVHFIQIDRPMKSLDEANAFVQATDETSGKTIRDEMLASDGHILDAFNRVFGASAQQAAARLHQMQATGKFNRSKKGNP